MKSIFWVMGLGLVAMGAPALAHPHPFAQPWGRPGKQQLIFPYRGFIPHFPGGPMHSGANIFVAPLHAQPVFGTLVPRSVTIHPYVHYNSRFGFSYGFTAFPGAVAPTVGGYVTPVFGPGFVIHPNVRW